MRSSERSGPGCDNMSLALIPLAAFLAVATWQDVTEHVVERWTFVFAGLMLVAGFMAGFWPLHVGGALLGCALIWIAGAPTGDRLGAAVIGLVLGDGLVVLVVMAALACCFIWWVQWGSRRSPADFAFFPFLSIGVGGTVLYHAVDLLRVYLRV